MEARTFTVVSAHFGDLFWITQLAESVERFSSESVVPEIVLINQDRTFATYTRLMELPRVKSVLELPIDHGQIALLGHDHPAALNHAIKYNFATTHVIVMDSDCFPLSDDWLIRVDALLSSHTAIVARDTTKWGLSHPCFMVFPVSECGQIDFAEGLLEVGMDTGRLVGLQLVKAGVDVYFDRCQRAFRGRRGFFYLDGCVYHHESASFISSEKDVLRGQVYEYIERFFLKKVAVRNFSLTKVDRIKLKLLSFWSKQF